MNFLRNLFGKKQSADNQPKKITVAGDQNAEWTDKPLRCPKCGAKLNEKTPRYAMVRCSECSAAFTIRNYNVQ